MSNKTNEEIENMNKQLKQIENNNKSINNTFLSILTDEQIFELFDGCNINNFVNIIISNKNGFDNNAVIDLKHYCILHVIKTIR